MSEGSEGNPEGLPAGGDDELGGLRNLVASVSVRGLRNYNDDDMQHKAYLSNILAEKMERDSRYCHR